MFVFDSTIDFNNSISQKNCFEGFDSDKKGYLDEEDFLNLLQTLVSSETKLNITDSTVLFRSFDKNADGKIDSEEFKIVWLNWIQKLLKPVTALLVIDVQNDFIDGSLSLKCCSAKQDAKETIPIINEIQKNFNIIVYSLDFHPENHISFFDNMKNYKLSKNFEESVSEIKLFDVVKFTKPIEMEQKLWPKHCVQNTWGAELHPDLKVEENSIFIHKGTKHNIDSYSAFYDNLKLSETSLHSELQKRNVSHVFVCGIAYDYCVAFTALDALELGYATVIIEDATKGTDFENIKIMTKKLISNNGVITNSSKLDSLMKAESIQLEFAKVLGSCI